MISARAVRRLSARELINECENRPERRRVDCPGRRDAADVPNPRRLFDRGQRRGGGRSDADPHRPHAGHLRRQRDHRLLDGSVPSGAQRRRTPEAVGRAEARRDHADHDRRAELHRDTRRRAGRRQKLRGVAMRTIKTTSGVGITLDGDLLAVMEALYQEVTARRGLERSFEDMVQEIQHLIEQMDDGERRTYLAESLFLNTVKYENDKLDAYMRKLSKVTDDGR